MWRGRGHTGSAAPCRQGRDVRLIQTRRRLLGVLNSFHTTQKFHVYVGTRKTHVHTEPERGRSLAVLPRCEGDMWKGLGPTELRMNGRTGHWSITQQ